ncbi:hypothetical protein FIBSPDRAFT_1038065 [Athelia psychrophila]|uniref:Uncharacterized protein n=1 Tax=Athelia psychrophila TaxID=1759441 RepID=A0A166TNY3_9AGAM|nr:hypothetical protein FIBSPDRAFT_1038065 [Fibularhizoctonia sp. CBS 109695]
MRALPPPPRRRPGIFVPTGEDGNQSHAASRAGTSWFTRNKSNPLLALYIHHNVQLPRNNQDLPSETIDLERTVMSAGTLWPTHVLAVSPQNTDSLTLDGEGNPWRPFFVRGTPSSSTIITFPVIQIEVPHPDSIPLLLLFALGLEPNLDLFSRQLLPTDVMLEFPDVDAMVIRMEEQLDPDGIQEYHVRNRHLWFNSLRLGVLDKQVFKRIELCYKVTVRAQERQRSGTTPLIIVDAAE